MMESVAPQLKKQAVLDKFSFLQNDYEKLASTNKSDYEHFIEVAVALEKEHLTEQVDEVRQALRSLCESDAALISRSLALRAAQLRYECSMEATDFERLLSEPPQPASNVDELEIISRFEHQLWDVHHRGVPMPGQEDEEMTMMGAGSDFKNSKCPLTLENIRDLADPVEDQEQIVYDKAAITNYIKKRGSVPCPQAGTYHRVQLSDLRPCARLLREMKKRKMAETQGNFSKKSMIVKQDIEELDEN